ncbi:response regulator [Rothia uropygialis]|uniref:response regulator n=1 Tax=Kocuria sp. 36 TaxID=1415402 RepID=UPI00101D574B|nr:response regulator [Kocuria sp. 36]
MTNVLVVDDDLYVGQLHCEYVNQTAGFEALDPVRDTRAAREVLGCGEVDLLLADYVLPDGNGVELLRGFEVDAAILSAVSDASVVRSALRAGALTYIFKPFDAAHLQGFLRRYSRYRRLLDRDRLDQSSLDRALRSLTESGGSSANAPVPGSSTSGRVLDVLRAARGLMSAAEVAEAVGISRATAQRHLVKLAESRSVTVTLHYGSTGRPEHLYGPER